MAAPSLQFTFSIGGTNEKPILILTDTTDYEATDTTVTTRSWSITDTDGKTVTLPDPLGEVTHAFLQDSAWVIKLRINGDADSEFSGYNKQIHVLAKPFLDAALFDIQKELISTYKGNCTAAAFVSLLDTATLISFYEEASRRLVSIDIVAAQKALDQGNLEVENFKHACSCG